MREENDWACAAEGLESGTLSRRSFLVGAGATGALTMLGLALRSCNVGLDGRDRVVWGCG